MTITPPPITALLYGVVWTLKKGHAIYTGCSGEGPKKMDRQDGTDIPIIPECDNNNDDDEASEDANEPSFFHTEYQWNTVEISYDFQSDKNDPLVGFEIHARVYSVRRTIQQGEIGEDQEVYEFVEWVPYRVTNARLRSRDPNKGSTWVYPDDYDVDVDANHPTQYGGVILFEDNTPVDKEADTKFEMGINSGQDEDGFVYWTDTNGSQQRTLSAYTYTDVFDKAEFSFIPRNTYENKKVGDGETFISYPYFPDVKDPNNLAAPIYPMNAITSFIPDPRESLTVTYIAELDIEILDEDGDVLTGTVMNPKVTIQQTVEQETTDYIKQLEDLQNLCQFSNPGGWKVDELSPNYNYDYPYTIVSNDEPTEREDDKNNEPLQRGDIWFRPDTDFEGEGERLTWSVADIPERVTIVNPGTNYRNSKGVLAIKLYQMDDSFDKDLYPNGRPPRGYENIDLGHAVGLLVDLDTEDGQIKSISISPNSTPSGWADGDLVRIVGGNSDGEGRIHIDNPPRWSKEFIDKY